LRGTCEEKGKRKSEGETKREFFHGIS